MNIVEPMLLSFRLPKIQSQLLTLQVGVPASSALILSTTRTQTITLPLSLFPTKCHLSHNHNLKLLLLLLTPRLQPVLKAVLISATPIGLAIVVLAESASKWTLPVVNVFPFFWFNRHTTNVNRMRFIPTILVFV
jgi:hypothetical protein